MAVGYPGVPGNPNEPKKDDRVQGTVLGSDPVNALIRTPDNEIVIVDAKTGKRRT